MAGEGEGEEELLSSLPPEEEVDLLPPDLVMMASGWGDPSAELGGETDPPWLPAPPRSELDLRFLEKNHLPEKPLPVRFLLERLRAISSASASVRERELLSEREVLRAVLLVVAAAVVVVVGAMWGGMGYLGYENTSFKTLLCKGRSPSDTIYF